jgi:predicted RNA binding protein YcfA (HicA-like mRNA interferase family)
MIIIKRKDFIKELKNLGYEYQRQTGSHHLYSNGEKTVAIPNSLNPCIALRLAKETGATNLIDRRNK